MINQPILQKDSCVQQQKKKIRAYSLFITNN